MESLTADDVRALPVSVDVVTAGRVLGISRTKAYQLVKANEFPCRVLRLGRSYRVPTAELLAVLGMRSDSSVEGREIQ